MRNTNNIIHHLSRRPIGSSSCSIRVSTLLSLFALFYVYVLCFDFNAQILFSRQLSSESPAPPQQLFQPSSPQRWRPDREWLTMCAERVVSNTSGDMIPFPSIRVGYVLGDCMKMCYRCDLDHHTIVKEGFGNGTLATQQFLAKQYYNMACPLEHNDYVSGGNMTIIEHLLRNYEQQQQQQHYNHKSLPKPEQDSLVIHLRLGDVMEMAQIDAITMLVEGGDPAHMENFKTAIKSVNEYIDNIEAANVTKVYIVGGGYGNVEQYNKSRIYAHCLERGLQQAGYHVTTKLDSGNADADFYFMTHAKYFVPTTGGFSTLITRLVEHFGGTIMGRKFDDMNIIKWYETIYQQVKYDLTRQQQQQ